MTSHHFGPIDRTTIQSLSGKALLERMIAGQQPQAPIGQTLSFWLVEVGDGVAVFEGEPSAALLNPLGTVHGGWALTLIDSAAGCACHTLLAAGVGYTTIETKVNFCRAILPDAGPVRAEGRVIHQGKTIMTAEAKVLDTQGRLLAHGTSTLMVLAPRH